MLGRGGEKWVVSGDSQKVESMVLVLDTGEEEEEGIAQESPRLLACAGDWVVVSCAETGNLEEDVAVGGVGRVHEFSVGYIEFVVSYGNVKWYVQMQESHKGQRRGQG